jgi:hypothetical protein
VAPLKFMLHVNLIAMSDKGKSLKIQLASNIKASSMLNKL